MVFFSSYFKTAALCVAAIISVALTAQESKVKMGVPAFESTATDKSLGKSVADLVLNELRQNKNYQLVDIGANFDRSNATQAAKEAGLDYVVLGALEANSRLDTNDAVTLNGKYYPKTYSTVYDVKINIRVIEVETDKIVITASESDRYTRNHGQTKPSGVARDDYFKAAEKPIKKIGFKIMSEIHPLDPAVIQIKGKDLTLDMGSSDGITEKQRFAIVREGKPLYNRNGDLIGVDVIEIAHITITRVEANVSYAKIAKVMKDPDTKKEYEIQVGDTAKMQDATKGRTFGEKLGGFGKDLIK